MHVGYCPTLSNWQALLSAVPLVDDRTPAGIASLMTQYPDFVPALPRQAAESLRSALTFKSTSFPVDSIAVYDTVVLPPHPDRVTLDVQFWDSYFRDNNWAVRVTWMQSTSTIHRGYMCYTDCSVPRFSHVVESGGVEEWRAAASTLFDRVSRQSGDGFVNQVEALALLRQSK